MPCCRIQRRRARATSARSCFLRAGFFECNLVALKEAPDYRASARNLMFAHCQDHFIQRQPIIDQIQQKIRMLLQRRDTSAPRFGRATARLKKAFNPDNRWH